MNRTEFFPSAVRNRRGEYRDGSEGSPRQATVRPVYSAFMAPRSLQIEHKKGATDFVEWQECNMDTSVSSHWGTSELPQQVNITLQKVISDSICLVMPNTRTNRRIDGECVV